MLQDLIRDLHYAVRTLRRSPGFTATAILTLALGIGAHTAIFSILDPLLLRKLPVTHPEELVRVDGAGTLGNAGACEARAYERLNHTSAFAGVLAVPGCNRGIDLVLDDLGYLADRCRKLAAGLQLPFAGIDLRRTPEDEWVCFEVNPSPGTPRAFLS
jgi:hypothetical protein